MNEVETWYTAALRAWLHDGGGQHALDALNAELERRMTHATHAGHPPTPTLQPTRPLAVPEPRRRWRLFSARQLATKGAR